MENLPKRARGRPRKIPEVPEYRKLAGEVRRLPKGFPPVGVDIPTERTAANRYYADRGRRVVAALSNSEVVRIPHDPVLAAKLRAGMDWITQRTTVAAEIGRMVESDSQIP